MKNGVVIKTKQDIEHMKVACREAAMVLEYIEEHVRPGVSTNELNRLCHEKITSRGLIPAPLNYKGFPKSICTSVNHVVCHGIPSDKKLVDGDIVNIDITVIKNGYHGDTSKMFTVGKPTSSGKLICQHTQKALYEGIKAVKPGAKLGDIGASIYEYASSVGLSVVREYCGHGIGKDFHEEPHVLHYGTRGTGLELEPNMIFTIEPMLNLGRKEVKLLADGWTVITKDRTLSAQWEHTILVTETGYDILTIRNDESEFPKVGNN